MTAYTPCFRREAGSYGKDVRGLQPPAPVRQGGDRAAVACPKSPTRRSTAWLAHVEGIVKSLGLPYRILRLCGGDMSFTSALTYDFEVYSEAQKRWLEVSSVSNFESFQANRLKLRYRDEEKKIQLATHAERLLAGPAAHRGGAARKLPDPGRHPHPRSAGSLHGF